MIISPSGLYPNLRALQERALRQMGPQLSFAEQFKDSIPDQYPWILHALSANVGAKYTGGVPASPRIRVLPYQHNDESHCVLIGGFWEDIKLGRMFVCTTRTVSAHAPVEATPASMANKKNPDRAISAENERYQISEERTFRFRRNNIIASPYQPSPKSRAISSGYRLSTLVYL